MSGSFKLFRKAGKPNVMVRQCLQTWVTRIKPYSPCQEFTFRMNVSPAEIISMQGPLEYQKMVRKISVERTFIVGRRSWAHTATVWLDVGPPYPETRYASADFDDLV